MTRPEACATHYSFVSAETGRIEAENDYSISCHGVTMTHAELGGTS